MLLSLVLGLVLEAPRGQVFKSLVLVLVGLVLVLAGEVLVLVLVLLGPVLVLVLVLQKRSCLHHWLLSSIQIKSGCYAHELGYAD